MSLNFADIADKKIADVERPALAPAGTYRWKVAKLPEIGNISSANGEWDTVTFSVTAQEAQDDVDPDLLAQYGKVTNIVNSVRFMFDKNDKAAFERTQWQLRQFLEVHLGVADENTSIKEALNNSVGAEFLGVLGHRQDKTDKDLFHANLGKTAPLA